MTILQPLGNDKHPSSCMNRLVGNTDLVPAFRLFDFTTTSDLLPYHLRVFDCLAVGAISVKYLS